MYMIKYDPQIYHRKSIRLKGYDYSQEGMYFITICTYDREYLFGNIVYVDDVRVENVGVVGVENFQPLHFQPLQPQIMQLNDAGKIANECWLQIPMHFPNVILHEFIVMPNHVHGIIELVEPVVKGVENVGVDNVGVENFQPLPSNFQPLPSKQSTTPQRNEFQNIIPHSIGSIIRGYKIGVTKWFRNNIAPVGVENFQPLIPISSKPIWQRNYYEHVIRNNQSYQNISNYIINNPTKWKEDIFFMP